MKESKYNFILALPNNGKKIIYNSRSNALAIIDEEEIDVLKNLDLEFGIENKCLEELREGGFVIADDLDELQEIKFSLYSSRFSTTDLSLTIAPTADCNFRCSYCYEKDNLKNAYMSVETQNRLLRFVEDKAKTLRSLNVVWYGGEPLLAMDIIERLSDSFQKLALKFGFEYKAFMVTNGYLLSRKIAGKLKELNIGGMQITLDGGQREHDERRMLKNGMGTYRKILENLKETIDILPNVAIRINVDKNNIDRIQGTLDDIQSFNQGDRLIPYLGKVDSLNGVYDDNQCLGSEMFFDYELEFYRKSNRNSLQTKYPVPRTNFCGADYYNSYVIDYEGNMYKCWTDIGIEEKKIGQLQDEETLITNKKTYLDYMLYDVTADEVCKNCNILPLCMGGCPYTRQTQKRRDCVSYKYKLEQYLTEIAQDLQ